MECCVALLHSILFNLNNFILLQQKLIMKTKCTLFFLAFTIVVNMPVKLNAQAINLQDSLALVDLYDSTNGQNWNIHTNWLAGPVTTWYGIGISGTHVTGIYLGQNNLSGTIPVSIGNLSALTDLHLYENKLTGKIPPSLGKLSSLVYLYLNVNMLSGKIPATLGKLTKLELLDLSSNELTGIIPAELGYMTALKTLYLPDNKLSGGIPYQLGGLTLKALSLRNNKLTGSIPAELGNLTALTELILEGNKLTGSIPSQLGNLSVLSYLILSNNFLSGSIPATLGNLSHLSSLQLDHNAFTGTVPKSIGNDTSLNYLSFGHNRLDGAIPFTLGNLKNLVSLDLQYNDFTGNIPASFSNLTNLFSLLLNNNHFRGDISFVASHLTNLGAFDLTYNHYNFTGLEYVAQAIPAATYNYQAKIPVFQIGNMLSLAAGGTLSNNTYTWFNETSGQQVAIIQGDSVFHPAEDGIYFATVTNSIATQLTLQSNNVAYTMTSLSGNNIAAVAKASPVIKKEGTFIIYPNPAKDIIHIQTIAKTTVTLTDQSGRSILTKTINGNEAMDVAHLPSGLYYLKNDKTGVVQKVLITK
jgi:Leucine-rich repeat (LRR) protein